MSTTPTTLDTNRLHEILLAAWDPGSERLRLEAGALGSPKVSALFGSFLEQSTLAVDACPRPVLEDGKVIVRAGKLGHAFLGLEKPNVWAEFFLDGTSNAQARIVLSQERSGYLLSAPFPRLRGSEPGMLPFKNPAYTLESDFAPTDDTALLALQQQYASSMFDDEPLVKKGLRLKGMVSFGESYDWIIAFLAGRDLVTEGPIQVIGDVSRMALHTLVKESALGPFTMSLSFDLVSVFVAATDGQDRRVFCPMPLNRLNGALKYTDSPVPEIPVSVVIPGHKPQWLVIESKLGKVSRYALKEFGKLLSGQNPVAFLPEGFPGADAVELHRLSVTARFGPTRIDNLEAELRLLEVQRFVILPGVMALGDIRLLFTVRSPFTPNAVMGAECSGSLFLDTAVVVGRFDGRFAIYTDKTFTFACGLGKYSYIDITAFIKKLLPLPQGFPKVECRHLEISGARTARGTSFAFACNIESSLKVPLGLTDLEVRQLSLTFDYASGSVVEKSISLLGILSLGQKLELTLLAAVSRTGWLFRGKMAFSEEIRLEDVLPAALTLPEEILTMSLSSLEATLDTGEKSLHLTVVAKTGLTFGEMGHAEISTIDLHFAKTVGGYKWSIGSQCKLKLLETERRGEYFVDISGHLEIKGDSKNSKYGIFYTSDPGSGHFRNVPVLIPSSFDGPAPVWSEAEFRIADLAIDYENKEWAFRAGFLLKLTRKPAFLDGVIPGDMKVALAISKKEATIGLENPIKKDIDNLIIPGLGESVPPFHTGKSRFQIDSVKIVLGKSKLGVRANVRYYLPTRINHLLGTDGNGKPKMVVFHTFDPDAPDGGKYLGLTFDAGYGNGIIRAGITPSAIPLGIVSPAADPKYWAVNFGPKTEPDKYGSLWIEKPELSLDAGKGGFKASGGFVIKKDPTIPLDLLKHLMEMSHLKKLAENLPAGITIPLLDPPKFVDGHGDLDVDGLNAFLGNKLPQDILKALRTVASFVKKLPTSLSGYLNLRIPQELRFHLKLGPTGSFEAGLTANPGVKLLFLQPNPTAVVTGLELRELSIGEMFSGQLFNFRIDADIDLFDPITLAAAVLAPEDWHPYLGKPRDFRRRVSLHKLLVLVIWQTQIPIPVPLFYDKVAIDYYGLGDITLQSGLSFKEPASNLREIGKLFKDLLKFVSDRQFALDPEAIYTDFTLQLKILPNYLQTGAYMGGQVFGLKEGLEIPSLYKIVALMLNGIKFFDVVAFVQAIPVKNRHGAGKAVRGFMGISADVAWLIATPQEFIDQKAYELLVPNRDQANSLMKILPGRGSEPVTPKDRGLVIFLKGDFKTDYGTLETAFGLVALDGGRFMTGFRLAGTVAKLFDIDLTATLIIKPPETPFALMAAGKTQLRLLGLTIFSAEPRVSAGRDKLEMYGDFSLLGDNRLVYLRSTQPIGGTLARSSLSVGGGVEGRFLIFSASGSGRIANDGITFRLRFTGDEAVFALTREVVDFEGERLEAIRLKGDISTLFTTLVADMILAPSKGRILATLSSNVFAGLLSTDVRFAAHLDTGLIGAEGTFRLWMLKAFNPEAAYQRTFKAEAGRFPLPKGRFDLFPPTAAVRVTGELDGELSKDALMLKGSGTFAVGDVVLGGNISVDQKGITGNFVGALLIYQCSIALAVENPNGQLRLGTGVFAMALLPVFKGSMTVNAGYRNVAIRGVFSLLEVGSLIYIRSKPGAEMLGELGPGTLQLSGGVEGRFLLFTASGSASMGIETVGFELVILDRPAGFSAAVKNGTVDLTGNIPLLWAQFATRIVINQPANNLDVRLDSSPIAGLLDMSLHFNVTLGTSYDGAKGSFKLFILRIINKDPILDVETTLYPDRFDVGGRLDLFPPESPIVCGGRVEGYVRSNGFSFSGDIQLGLRFAPMGGEITVSHTGIGGFVNLPSVGRVGFGIRVWNGKLYFYGQFQLGNKTYDYYIVDGIMYPTRCPCLGVTARRRADRYARVHAVLEAAHGALLNGLVAWQHDPGLVSPVTGVLVEKEVLGSYRLVVAVVPPNARITDEMRFRYVATRTSRKTDMFTEIRDVVEARTGRRLNISGASAELELSFREEDPGWLVTLRFHKERKLSLRAISVPLDSNRTDRFHALVIQKVRANA